MDNLWHDLLLIILVWMLFSYWPMGEISRQKGGHQEEATEPAPERFY